jgi:hypothetical protein
MQRWREEILNAEAESLVIEAAALGHPARSPNRSYVRKSRQADPAGHGASTSAAETDDNQIAVVQARQQYFPRL